MPREHGRRRRRRWLAAAAVAAAIAALAGLAAALTMTGLIAAELNAWQDRHAAPELPVAASVAIIEEQAPQATPHPLSPPPPPAAAAPPAEPTQQAPGPPPAQRRELEADRLVADMQAHVAAHGPAASFWPAGCRWRERSGAAPPASAACDPASVPRRAAMFGGVESVWRCHTYEWSADGREWQLEQPAACRLQPVPLAAWAADRARLQPGNSSASWGSAASMATWALQSLQQQQQAEQQGAEQQGHPQEQHPVAAVHSSSADGSGSRPAAAAGLPRGSLASEVACARHYCVFKNLLYSQGRFYMLFEPDRCGCAWEG